LRGAGLGTYPDRFAVCRVEEPVFGFWASAFGFGGPGFELRDSCSEFRDLGFGVRVSDLGISGFGWYMLYAPEA